MAIAIGLRVSPTEITFAVAAVEGITAQIRALDALKDNHVRESLGNGYSRIIPVDTTKLFKAKG